MIGTGKMKKVTKSFFVLFSIAVLTGLWFLIHWIINSDLIFPGPIYVFQCLWKNAQTSFFWQNVLATIIRSFTAFCISVILSLIIGFTAGIHPAFEAFIQFPIAIIKTAPVVSFILLSLFWFPSDFVPVFVSVLMTLPVITSSIISGLKSADPKLLAMAKVYGFTKKQIYMYIYKPVTIPYFFSGAYSAFGLSWKVVAAGEVLTLPRYAIGTQLQTAKVHLETADVFAFTITIILISFICESIFGACTRKKRVKK